MKTENVEKLYYVGYNLATLLAWGYKSKSLETIDVKDQYLIQKSCKLSIIIYNNLNSKYYKRSLIKQYFKNCKNKKLFSILKITQSK